MRLNGTEMMKIKSVDEHKGIIVFCCPTCEVKYGIDVDVELNTKNGFSERKYKRVFEFMDVHENCYPWIWRQKEFTDQYGFGLAKMVGDMEFTPKVEAKETKDWGHPLINKAIELFQPTRIQVFPYMEEKDKE